MLLSSVMLTFFTLFAKFGTDTTSYFLLIFLRFCIPLMLLLPYLLWTISIKELFLTNNFKMQLLRCGCILLYQYSIFYYLMYSTLLDATVMQNTAPLFMPILERVFFKHRFESIIGANAWLHHLRQSIGLSVLRRDLKETTNMMANKLLHIFR